MDSRTRGAGCVGGDMSFEGSSSSLTMRVQHAHSELREIHEELSLGSASQHFALQSELGDLLFNAFLLVKVEEDEGRDPSV